VGNLKNPSIRLAVTRYVYFLSAVLSLIFLGLGLVNYYHHMAVLDAHAVLTTPWTAASLRQALTEAGESLTVYATFQSVFMGLFGLGFAAISLVLVLKRPNDRGALLVGLILLLFGTSYVPIYDSLMVDVPALRLVIQLWNNLGFLTFFLLFYLFPDGRFVPRWTVFTATLWCLLLYVGPFLFPGTILDVNRWQPLPNTLAFLAYMLTFIYAQIYRYRVVSTPLQRQQTKLVVMGMLVALITFLANWLIGLIPPLNQPGIPALVYTHLQTICYFFAFMSIPVSLWFAILRYHLFDVDFIIRRTLLYGLLTTSLGAVYFTSVVLLQQVLSRLTGQSQGAIVVSTLLVAALFNPLRRGIQETINRRFYRKKYDAARTMEHFSASLRYQVEMDQLTNELVEVVEETVQPETTTLWLLRGKK
jgi:hypothetical protein